MWASQRVLTFAMCDEVLERFTTMASQEGLSEITNRACMGIVEIQLMGFDGKRICDYDLNTRRTGGCDALGSGRMVECLLGQIGSLGELVGSASSRDKRYSSMTRSWARAGLGRWQQ